MEDPPPWTQVRKVRAVPSQEGLGPPAAGDSQQSGAASFSGARSWAGPGAQGRPCTHHTHGDEDGDLMDHVHHGLRGEKSRHPWAQTTGPCSDEAQACPGALCLPTGHTPQERNLAGEGGSGDGPRGFHQRNGEVRGLKEGRGRWRPGL